MAGADASVLGGGLLQAADIGRRDVVQALLDQGAEVDWQDAAGDTPLLKAARNGWTDIVSDLLLSGAHIDHANHRGQTALFLAAWRPMDPSQADLSPPKRSPSHDETVRALLRRGAETEIYPAGDLQPVTAAGVNGNIAAMIELLAEGARFLSDEVVGRGPRSPGLVEAIEDLTAAADAPRRPRPALYQGWTPLPVDDPARRRQLLDALLTAGSAYADEAERIIAERAVKP